MIEVVVLWFGNIFIICCKCYIYFEIFDSYFSDELVFEVRDVIEKELRDDVVSLRLEEVVVFVFL